MKAILLLLAIGLFSCSNNSDQKKAYQDSANMMLDSLEKYKPMAEVKDDSAEIVRKNKYAMFKIMYDHYKSKLP